MTADDTSREAMIERVRELQRSVRELQATRDTYREHWRRLMRDYEAVFKERDELESALYVRDEQIEALWERVRQRDVVIERVRALADRAMQHVPAITVDDLRAALEGDGR